MANQRKFEIGVFVVALVIAAVFCVQWLKAREANIRASAVQAADQAEQAHLQADIAGRDAQAAAFAQQTKAQAAQVTTPQAANRILSAAIAGSVSSSASGRAASHTEASVLLQPVATVQAGNATPVDLPNAPKGTVLTLLTPDQSEALARASLACQATEVTLQACTADKADLQAELGAETKTAATWEAAAKGGSRWTRFGRVVKFVACAGAGAGLGAVVDKSHAAQGSAIGSAAAVVGCSFVGK